MHGHASLRTTVIITVSAGFAIAGAAAVAVRGFCALGPAYVGTTALVFAAMAAVVVSAVEHGHPYPTFGPANAVTTMRAAGVALVAALVAEPSSPATATTVVWIATIVTALDGVDGWLARRTRMESAFGARFDMETDALLILALSVLAWEYGKAGAWIILSGLLRYLFVVAGWMWAWMQRPLPPRFRRKTICVVQIVALLVALLPGVVPPASTLVAAVSLVLLAWSFAVDTAWLWRPVKGRPA